MARLTGLLLASLVLTLGVFGLVADRALAERARRETEAALAASQETARLTALSVRAALAQVEQAVVDRKPAPGIEMDHLAEAPGLIARGDTRPYASRPRAELARLLGSTRATPNGLPEAVVARLALGETPVSLGTEPPPDVVERLLSGLLPVRVSDLRFLAKRLGAGSDPRVASLEQRLRRAPPSGIPGLPAFLRTRAGDRVEGWARANDTRFHYVVTLGSLYDRAGVAPRLVAEGKGGGVDADVPDVPGLVLRVRADGPRGLGGQGLRLLLWAAVAGSAFGLFVVGRALRREAQATARERAFLAGVTHELRTPLSAIRLFGETLAAGRGDAREYGSLVAQESERLEALVERVLAVTRVDEAPCFSSLAPAALVHSAVALIRPRAERRAVTLETELAEPLPEVTWDEEAVRRALLSLIDNAVKHGRERGRVTVTAAASEPGLVRLAVADDGPGIARREHRRIFGRFARGESTVEGTGLGLYLAEQVAFAHGGRIDLETEAGRGSTFSLVLPIVPPAVRGAGAS
jgi:signal transduction histidine kinase